MSGRGRGGGGNKRRGGGGGGDGGGGKKGKYAGMKHGADAPAPRSSSGQALALGSRGVLITCDLGKEERSANDAATLFEEHYQKVRTALGITVTAPDAAAEAAAAAAAPDLKEEPSTSGTPAATPAAAAAPAAAEAAAPVVKDIGALIAEEVAGIKDQSGRVFRTHHTGVKGTVYVIFPQQPVHPSPEEVVLSIMREVKESKNLPCRHILRMVPLSHTCFASMDSIKEMAPKLLEGHFAADAEPIEFAVDYEHRSADNFDRMAVVNAFVDNVLVPPHKVNLTAPAKTVMVQLMRNGCGASVITAYRELSKYNIRKLVEPDEDEAAKKERVDKEEKAKVARLAKKAAEEAKKAAAAAGEPAGDAPAAAAAPAEAAAPAAAALTEAAVEPAPAAAEVEGTA